MTKYGKANYGNADGGNFESTPYYKLTFRKNPNIHSLVLRLAPPTKKLSEKGIWSVYIRPGIQYGSRQDIYKPILPAVSLIF